MPAKKKSLKSKIKAKAAKKAAATRARNKELEKIEKLRGEDFENLSQARKALKAETVPVSKEPQTLREYEALYDEAGDDDSAFEDQGEAEGGVDY